MSHLALSADQIDLWGVCYGDSVNSELLEEARERLPSNELAALSAKGLPEVIAQRILRRALVRAVLSKYAALSPQEWSFEANEFGKPRVAVAGCEDLMFSVSHAKGMAVSGVTRGAALGVDVEALERQPDSMEIAGRFFSSAEAAALESVDSDQRDGEFYRYWTYKEAYLKALGTGLSTSLDSFSISLREGEPAQVAVVGEGNSRPPACTLAEVSFGGRFQIAVARLDTTVPRIMLAVGDGIHEALHRERLELPTEKARRWWVTEGCRLDDPKSPG